MTRAQLHARKFLTVEAIELALLKLAREADTCPAAKLEFKVQLSHALKERLAKLKGERK